MKLIPLSEAKNKLSSIVHDAEQTPVVLTRNGKAVAVVIAPENEDDLEQLVMSRSNACSAGCKKAVSKLRVVKCCQVMKCLGISIKLKILK